ncbi:MAG: hypothetical protein AAF583_00705 [Pseudomonadota bacterium]
MKCPEFASSVVIADDAELAAICSSYLLEKSKYLTVLDGPRITRDDREAEATRRNNVVARVRPKRVVFAGLSDKSTAMFSNRFPASLVTKINSDEDVRRELQTEHGSGRNTLSWGRKHIGVGLLKALQANSTISFSDEAACAPELASKSGHMVICEAGEPISEVIAANYAYSLRAGLRIIPKVSNAVGGEILEGFYSLYDQSENSISPSTQLEELKARIRLLCGEFNTEDIRSLTFISKDIPYGFAFPEVPSTHLFTYPDLGLSVANGFFAEQKGSRGTNVSVLVDPETTPAPEIETISKTLSEKRGFVRGYSGRGATVARVSNMVDLFPYDLLIFATHCGDAPGYRWTYEYEDSSKRTRRLVVDIALGIGATRKKGILEVTKFQRFHELDGVDWRDPDKSNKIDIGTAIRDFVELDREDNDFQPIEKQNLDRVLGSAALKMSDNNYLPLPNSIASNGTPVIINNACSSWQNLAGRFTFAGCRCYVGTLYPVSTIEANDVMTSVFSKQWGKCLPHALWSAQNATYGASGRRPYVVTGVFCSKLRVSREEVPRYLRDQFFIGLQASEDLQKRAGQSGNEYQKNRAVDQIQFYRSELKGIRKRYGV